MFAEDVERVRLALLLTSELDVNLPGVEVIMHMRESMLAMQRQFTEILDTLVAEIRRQQQR
jgi:MerR family transcriptional regulator/heat shock protein HspR